MKRFWKEARVTAEDGGWTVLLDSRPVRTPAKRACVVPVRAMADAIAQEWAAQEDEVIPLSMPMTRAAATCLDRVAPEMPAVRRIVADYGGTDLLCYRAEYPQALTERQRLGWDPLLDWAAEALGARLALGQGVMHVAQDAAALAALDRSVDALDPWALTCLSEMVTISGSLVLGLAVGQGHLTADEAWALSRIDEQWNIDEWGEDAEAARQAAKREADFLHAAKVWAMVRET
ncbi:MAG: ATP12 family protein [Pseudomonadota bacterium]